MNRNKTQTKTKSHPFILTAAILALLSLSLLSSCSHSDELTAFTSDGCSAFPDGTLAMKTLWLSCCTAHDVAYWRGGTYDERLQADRELKQCVAQTGQDEIAKLMLAGVRVGGTPYLPTSFRWGYGWSYLRGYKALTDEEQAVVQLMLQAYEESKH